MSESPPHQNANGSSVPAEVGIDDVNHTPEEAYEVRENDLPRYRVELESVDGGTRLVSHVHAGSMEEALVKVREADQWPIGGSGSDPSRFRVVEATEESASSEARHQRNARRRYINTIVEAGLAALGTTVPHRPDDEFFDILCDFFTRTIVLPGHFTFPSENTDAERLLTTDDVSVVLARLLTTHLSHHRLTVTRTLPE